MALQNQNFESIYAYLTSQLLTACTTTFSASIASGSDTITGVPPGLPLVPFLAMVQGGCIPVGAKILAIDTVANTVQLNMPATADGASVTFQAGLVSVDPVQARLLRHWADVPASNQPALFVAQTGETAERRPGQLTKWTLDVLVYLYMQAEGDRYPVAPSMNALLGAVRGALEPDVSGPGRAQFHNTLGGQVFDCYISGKIETDEGYLGQQGVAKVPVRIIQNGP